MDGERHQHGQQDHPGGEQVHRHAPFLEGLEETGAYLEADGEYEEDEPEIFHESQDGRVAAESEVAEQDAQEQDPRGPDGDALDFDLAQPEPGGDDEGEEQQGMGDARAEE